MTMPAALRLVLAASLITLVVVPRYASGAQPPPAASAQTTPTGKEPLSLEQRANLYMVRKMYREAIDTYLQALPQGKDFAIYNMIGIAYHNMLDFRAAKRSYERALKLNPRYAEARNNLGALSYAQKNYRGAIREYQKALKLSPNSATIYSNLGTAHFARKQYEQAAKAWQQARALDPEVFEHRGTAGTILQERSVEERAKFFYFMAKIQAGAGDAERALLNIRRSLEEGFKERKRYLEEPEFKALRELPEFKELMAKEFRVL
jgi:tetratricopeptide (TPR) repeat protein